MTLEHSPSVGIYFRFYGASFDPDEITRRLETEPTSYYRAGDPVAGRTIPHRQDGWMIKIGPRETVEIEELLRELQERVDIPGVMVKQLCTDLQVRAVVVCAIVQPTSALTPALEFPASFLEWAANKGASINVDVELALDDPV
jgi:hypothetical protein